MFAEHHPIAPKTQVFTSLLTHWQQEQFISKGIIKTYAENECICKQGSKGDKLYIILSGEVEVRETIQDEEISIGSLRPGELFGEIAAIFDVPRIASVVATTPAEILLIDSVAFKEILDAMPEVKHCVYLNLYERSLDTALQCMHVDDKLAVQELSRVLSCWEADNDYEVNVNSDGIQVASGFS